MNERFARSRVMLGDTALERLSKAHVLVLGLGGVGGHAAEALCRGGVGTLSLVDPERFEITNCNRQRFATSETIGNLKVEAAKKCLLSINPACKIITYPLFFGQEDTPDLFDSVDYILDAIDTVSSKLLLIEEANRRGIPILSCMGTGNKLDPTAFRVSDIYKTKVCPLARVMRSECKKRGIKKLKVVYSEEEAMRAVASSENGRNAPGSVSFVPGVAGMIMAGEIIKDLID